MAKVILNVPDISCDHCVRTVTQVLQPIEGVRAVNVSLPTQQVQVDYDDKMVNVEQMKVVLDQEAYPVASVQPA
jgi:copper chaperone